MELQPGEIGELPPSLQPRQTNAMESVAMAGAQASSTVALTPAALLSDSRSAFENIGMILNSLAPQEPSPAQQQFAEVRRADPVVPPPKAFPGKAPPFPRAARHGPIQQKAPPAIKAPIPAPFRRRQDETLSI